MRGALSDRAVLFIDGDEARPFLQGLVTQDITHPDEAGAFFAALLTPQGKILFDFFLVPHGAGFFIDCAAGAADALLKRLALYKLRAKVSLSRRDDLAVAVGGFGETVAAYADPRLGAMPARAIIARSGDLANADEAYDGLRIALGVPEFGKDFAGEEVFLLDVNYDALNAVSYRKGCFVGQEVTSRMKRKSDIRKRTLIARFAGAAPAKGESVIAGDGSIGEILSGGDGRALALVRLDRLKAAESAGFAPVASGRALQIAFPAYLERG